MPYSGNPPIDRRTRFAWARLNADALFLALYAAFSGLFGIYEPGGQIVRDLGYATASHYLLHTGYLVGGLLLMLSLIKEWVSAEVVARFVLVWSVAFNLGREIYAFGWWPDGVQPFIVFAIVTLTTFLRLSVLLSKKGLVVHLPQRSNGTES